MINETETSIPSSSHKKNWIGFSVVALAMTFFLLNQIHNFGEYSANNLPLYLEIAHAQVAATLALSPTSNSVAVNGTFNVDIVLNTGGNPADGVDIYSLHFNPTILQVVDSNAGVAGVQIAPGSLMSNVAINTVDNVNGTIQFSESTPGGTSFTGSGVLATITFRGNSGGTSAATFDFTPGSTADTNVAYQGVDQLSSVTNGSYIVDATAPTVSISSPTSGATVSGTINVNATATDNIGVAGVQFKLDGANLGAEDTSSPYTVSWNTTGATNASHTLTAVARDAVGNTTTSTAVSVTVSNDTQAPTVSITAPATGPVSGTVTVSANATDNVGVVGVQFKLDGANLGAEDTTSPYSISWDTTTASAGTHTLTAVARDAAANSTTSAGVSVTVSSFDFSLTNGGSKSVTQGSNVTNTVTATLSSGTAQAVSFAASGLPTGVSASFSPTSCTPTCTSTLTLTATASATVGTTTTTITGTAGALSHTTTFSLTVVAATYQRTISLSLEGRSSPVITGSVDVLSSSNKTLIKSYSYTSNSLGTATVTFDITPQIVYLKIKATPFLTRLLSAIDLSSNVTYAFPQLLIGDINQDDIINSVDYSILNTNWFTSNASADLNQDGLVNSIDYSFMNKHWLVSGEQ